MVITKTNFINYSRCPRYVGLDEVKKNKEQADVSYEEYLEEELQERIKEISSSMFEIEQDGEESSVIDIIDPQLTTMMPYFQKIEQLAGKKVSKLFGGTSIYAEKTHNQKLFEYTDNYFKYICYVDIYNESDTINIIEVKATTDSQYLKDSTKPSLFTMCDDGIFRFKKEVKDYNIKSEMKEEDYEKRRLKFFNKYKIGKYVYDLAIQRMIIENDINYKDKKINYYLAVLNHEYVYDGATENGKPLYDSSIISIFDMTNITKEYQPFILEEKKNIEKYIKISSIAPVKLGEYCGRKSNTGCKYVPVCFNKVPEKHSVFSYMFVRGFKDQNGDTHSKLDLINEGYYSMLDIPLDWITNENNLIQRECLLSNKEYINKSKVDLGIKRLKYPIYHLDFETFPCPLPRFKGEKCYEQSPFQFSIHIEKTPGICDFDKDHYEYLSRDFDIDNREAICQKLCEYIGDNGTIFAQNCSFEKGVLKRLANSFPKYSEKLLSMMNRTSDLLYIIRNDKTFYELLNFNKKDISTVNYYNNDFDGSYSIKKTLGVFSDITYKNMDIGNGTEALVAYASYNTFSKEKREIVYKSLIEYCKLDTYAMFVILKGLRKKIE